MAVLIEEEIFEEGVYQLETTDPVQGGPNGIDNLQAKQLANRTKWLNENKQNKDAALSALAALAFTVDKMIYSTGVDTFALATLTAFARTLLDDADASTMRATLDVFSRTEVGSQITTAVHDLVGSSPSTLDTLKELATALGNDANFATTMINTLAEKASISDIVPPGTIIFTAQDSAPTGYLKANGSEISRTTYAALFTKIGTTFGNGNGSTTFNIPDLRGEFLRAWDDSRGIDANRGFGSFQDQSTQTHSHSVSTYSVYNVGGGVMVTAVGGMSGISGNTHPRNKALLVCIKY